MKSRKKNHRHPRPDLSKKGRRASGKTGLPPGSLVHIGKILTDSVTVSLNEINPSGIIRKKIQNLDGLEIGSDSFNGWIEVCGLHDTSIIDSFGKLLKINPLMLEDILNTEHRPKFDVQDGLLFLTLKAFSLSGTKEIQNEQVSFILGEKFLVSFQESDKSWFEPVKSRLSGPLGKTWQHDLDFIFYSLVDLIIDRYYAIVEAIGDQLEELEELIFENPNQDLFEKIRLIRKEIISIRKALVPSLEAVNKLNRDKPELIRPEIMLFFEDIDDHIIQILDYIDTYRELSAELKENYLSNISLRMNQVMKLLAIITTIFIPLSFIAGIYGMNFSNMPELSWKYGYFLVIGIMFIILIGMLIYFRRKKWM
ncbi:MAG: magnesium/cobalt transporter CorA [Bacteroidales bacterium]|nr:magnesium/cobalt transporter CorA [Bacteroidales bacterium]